MARSPHPKPEVRTVDPADAPPPPRPPRGQRHPDLTADAEQAAEDMIEAALRAVIDQWEPLIAGGPVPPRAVLPVTSDTATRWLDNRRPGRFGRRR